MNKDHKESRRGGALDCSGGDSYAQECPNSGDYVISAAAAVAAAVACFSESRFAILDISFLFSWCISFNPLHWGY